MKNDIPESEPKKPVSELVLKALSSFYKEEETIEDSDCPDCEAVNTFGFVQDHEVFLKTALDEEPRSVVVDALVCSECGYEAFDKNTSIYILEATDNKPYIKYMELSPDVLTKVILH